jgi:hypothetical protein
METGMLLESVSNNSNKNTVTTTKNDSENNPMVSSWPMPPDPMDCYSGSEVILRVVHYRKIYDISKAAGDSRVPQMR